MRVLVVPVLATLLAVLFSGAVSADGPLPVCQEDQPPSGLYQDAGRWHLYQYDCLTGLIVPHELEPHYGFCDEEAASVNGGGVCPYAEGAGGGDVRWRFSVALALVASYDNVVGDLYDVDTGEELVTCSTDTGCTLVQHGLVTWLDAQGETAVDCTDGPRTLRARVVLSGTSGSAWVVGPRLTVC